MKKILLPLFLLLVVIQWIVPAQMIWKKEDILKKGTPYKFRTEPIDPSDPFIGRYIILNYKDEELLVPTSEQLKNPEHVYVTFKNNKEGFAIIDKITETKPAGDSYLETSVYQFTRSEYMEIDAETDTVIHQGINRRADSVTLRINYKFNKFYMEESKAPEAERIYGTANVDSAAKVYALVSVYKGDALISNVYVNDTTISDIIRRNRKIRKD